MAQNQNKKPKKELSPKEQEKALKRAQKAAARRRRRSRETEGGFIVLALMIVIALGAVNVMMGVMCLIGLIPSLVMSITDRHPLADARLQCVALLNMAGIVQPALKVYANPQNWQAIVVDPTTMVVMWGSAAAGYFLLYIGPFIGSIVLQAFNQDRFKALSQQRQELLDTWGPEVMADANQPSEIEQQSKGAGSSAPRQRLIQPKN